MVLIRTHQEGVLERLQSWRQVGEAMTNLEILREKVYSFVKRTEFCE